MRLIPERGAGARFYSAQLKGHRPHRNDFVSRRRPNGDELRLVLAGARGPLAYVGALRDGNANYD